MNRKVFLLISVFAIHYTSIACTIFCGIDGRGHVLAANTEDHRPTMNIYFKVRAATDSTYGFFGTVYNHPDGWIQGGSNDQGLFFDTNELGTVPMRKSAGIKVYNLPVDPGTYVLQHCRNVQDVIDFFNTYYIELPSQVHVADKSGQFIIVANDTILHTRGTFQLTTNFHPLHHEIGVYPCWRYKAVSDCINKNGISHASFEEALFASTQHGNTMTIYSNVGDLTTGEWTYYAYGYQEAPFRFTIQELLKGGNKTVLLRDMFAKHPYLDYYKQSKEKTTQAAVSLWKQQKANYAARLRYEVPKAMIWNYLFWETDYTAAGAWLDIWWSSLTKAGAEDWMTKGVVQVLNGNHPEALHSFKECLQLDTSSQSARHYIDYLQKKYETGGRLNLTLKGYQHARVVSVGGLSSNPNYYLMHRSADGWEISISADPGYKMYYFLVEGKKVLDPLNSLRQVVPTVTGPEEMNIVELK
jgi:hypothetical protein